MTCWWNGPPSALPPPELGWFTAAGPEHEGGTRGQLHPPTTAQFNMTGQPAISLPLHWTPGGLPVGVQLVAPVRGGKTCSSGSARPARAGPPPGLTGIPR